MHNSRLHIDDLSRLCIPMSEKDKQLPCQVDRQCACGASSLRVGTDGKRTLVCSVHTRAIIDGERDLAEREHRDPKFIQFVPLWCIGMAQKYVSHQRAPRKSRGKMCRMPECKDYRKRGYDFCARCLAAINLVATDAGRTDLIPAKKEVVKPASVEKAPTDTPDELTEETAGSEPAATTQAPTDQPAAPTEAAPAPQTKDVPKKDSAGQTPPGLVIKGASAHHIGFANNPFAGLAKLREQRSAAQNG
jgi:hypothetical protein